MKIRKLIIAALPLAVSCNRPVDERPVLMVSIEPQRYILEQIAGPSYRVATMLENGANPETFDPAMARRADADRALAYFATGTLPFESTVRQSVSDSVEWVDTSWGIRMLHGTHSHGDGHNCEGEVDPHYWTSVGNARRMAVNMYMALAELNPDSAQAYQVRLNAFDARMAVLDQAVRERLEGKAGAAFAVWHPSLSYFANDYGLEQLAVGSESKEMSPRRVKEVIDHARRDSVRVFFFQQEYDSRQAESINDGIGSRLVTINPLSYDFEGQIMLIADEIARP